MNTRKLNQRIARLRARGTGFSDAIPRSPARRVDLYRRSGRGALHRRRGPVLESSQPPSNHQPPPAYNSDQDDEDFDMHYEDIPVPTMAATAEQRGKRPMPIHATLNTGRVCRFVHYHYISLTEDCLSAARYGYLARAWWPPRLRAGVLVRTRSKEGTWSNRNQDLPDLSRGARAFLSLPGLRTLAIGV